jgi:sugar phosphate isomerase/epimerase
MVEMKNKSDKTLDRRHFLKNSMAVIGAGALAIPGNMNAMGIVPMTETSAKPIARNNVKLPWRVGAVAYGFEYSIGLFKSRGRTGPRMDVFEFLDATRQTGGDVAQIFITMIDNLDENELIRLRNYAASLDVLIEVHAGSALSPRFEKAIQQAAFLGSKVIGCSFGMLMRPNRIATLDAWDKHMEDCHKRLKQLAAIAASYKIIVAVENHLDFTVEELRDLVASIDSPYVGVMFDVGNTIGTLDDPTEAADILGPYTVATHYKDFAIEEVARGFRFTMVPLGAGSLNLHGITERLHKYLKPGMGLSIELINGQQFEVNWLEDRFWVPFRNHNASNVASTLRHIRSKSIDIREYQPESEIDRLPHDIHVQLELDRMAQSTSYLRKLLAEFV